MRIGPYRVSSLETGELALDGGAMFGVVPKALWSKQLTADERNRVRLAMRALLVEEVEGPGVFLVDTGAGTKWSAEQADLFGIDHSRIALEASLARRGYQTGDITDVLLTHLHFDHAGGATRRAGAGGDGDVVPTFENARYWVQERNWRWAQQPSDKDRASYREENFGPLRRHGVLELIDGPGTWKPGIELILSEGHTTALQHPLVSGPGGAVFYCADLIPTAAHVRLPWVMSYDNHPLTTIDEKRRLLERGEAERWLFCLEHDREVSAVRVRHGERGPEVAERVDL